jgi:hypothetical protein
VEGSTTSKTKKRKQSVREETVKAPASLARMNEERMNVKNECETAGPFKCSGRALLKRGADAAGRTARKKDARRTEGPNADVASRTPGNRGRTVRLFGDEQPL